MNSLNFLHLSCIYRFAYLNIYRTIHSNIRAIHRFIIFQTNISVINRRQVFPPFCFPSICRFSNSLANSKEDVFENDEYKELIRPLWNIPKSGHRVVILQPNFLDSKHENNNQVASQYLLDETVSLVQNLNWTVKQKVILPVKEFCQYNFFDSNSSIIARKCIHDAHRSQDISAVVVSTHFLVGVQLANLEALFKVPVYDRNTLAVQILKNNARTEEAKLQIALAEIPGIKQRLIETYGKISLNLKRGGDGESLIETRHHLLKKRMIKLKIALRKVKYNLEKSRTALMNKEYPVVAVVGYSNAGKTSLIKALTKDTNLEPKKEMFSTLDVSPYTGILPNRMQVIYLDTIGFIMELSETLIESFSLTLEEIAFSDLILHVRDVSHPNYFQQSKRMIEILKTLQIPEKLLTTMIEIDNKTDLLSSGINPFIHPYPISSLTGEGIPSLVNSIQEKVMQALQKRDANSHSSKGTQKGNIYRKM